MVVGVRAETTRALPKAEEGRGQLPPRAHPAQTAEALRNEALFFIFEPQFIQHTVPPFKACDRVTSSIFGVV